MAEMTVAVWLDQAIARKRVTQGAGATYTGVSTAAISEWRAGRRIPDPKYCWKLADYFEEPVENVMRYAGHLPPPTEPPDEPAISREARELAFVYDALDRDAQEALTHIAQRLFEALPPADSTDQA